MGYTTGRRLTFNFMKNEALKYKTRAEFQHADSSCYTTARVGGVLDIICAHMKPCFFSVPQRICKQIFNKILNKDGDYNTRKIITPFELDLFYKEYNLAIEYCGKGWHEREECILRDKKKLLLCVERNINLLVIKENSRNYEEDIKFQIVQNLDWLNSITGMSITEGKIYSTVINYRDIFEIKDFDIDEIKIQIFRNKTIKEFKKENPKSWKILQQLGLLNLLDPLRKTKVMSDKELLDACKKIDNYTDFINNNRDLYSRCYKRNLLTLATVHMKRGKTPQVTIEQVLKIAKTFMYSSELKKKNQSYYVRLRKAGLLKELFVNRKPLKNAVTKEKIIKVAEKFSKKIEFKRANPNYYAKALSFGMMDILFPPASPEQILENIKSLTKNFKKRGEFRKVYPTNYEKLRKLELLDSLFPKSK